MPELPEVQTVVDDLERRIKGKIIGEVEFITRDIWRNGVPRKSELKGARILRLERKGKHIIIHLSNDRSLVVHLKMTGQLLIRNYHAPMARHTHLIAKLGRHELRFVDVRRFGFIDYVKTADLAGIGYIKALGPDALTISETDFVASLKKRKGRVKSLLMDQRAVSGLGNIYTDEILFAAGIHPARAGRKISAIRMKKLHQKMRLTLENALTSRGSSISDFVDGSGNPGEYQKYHKVYGKTGKPCPVCRTGIRKMIISGRSTHYCPHCQR